jgi:rhamnulokinase
MYDAVAVDLGASSIRFAHGKLLDGAIQFDIIKQIPNTPNGRCWDLELLAGFCREGAEFASRKGASLGIDSWGVDIGFLDSNGSPHSEPVMYRDTSHVVAAQDLADKHQDFFHETGVAYQPFNTVFQLMARAREDSSYKNLSWLPLPDFLGYLMTGVKNAELTECSTTQLMTKFGSWSQDVFDAIGWPVPEVELRAPGHVLGHFDRVPVVSVASHDTASAIVGSGSIEPGDIYLVLGTWALLGVLLPGADVSVKAWEGGWTNERAHDGRIRFLKNIPGLYIANRLHEELRIRESVGSWIESAEFSEDMVVDPLHQELYAPRSMSKAVASLLPRDPANWKEWAGCAVGSLIYGIGAGVCEIIDLGHRVSKIKVMGGGSRSARICQMIADRTGVPVETGPVEATVLGNLALQFVASGALDISQVPGVLAASHRPATFIPRAGQ